MTEPDIPPPMRGGGRGLAVFIAGGVVVALGLIAWVLLTEGLPLDRAERQIDVDLTLPTPTMPDGPRLPDGPPALPPVEPPPPPVPSPAPAL